MLRAIAIPGMAVALLLVTAGVHASTFQAFNAAYYEGDVARAETVREELSEASVYVLGLADYRLAGLYFGRGRKDDAEERLEKARDQLEAYLADNPEDSEVRAVLAGVEGYLAGLGFFKAMRMGPRAAQRLEAVMAANPDSATAHYIEGHSLYHRPSMFGGDKDAALKAFERAIELFQRQPDDDVHQWAHAEAHVWRAVIFQELGEADAARHSLHQALALVPNYRHARHLLAGLDAEDGE